MSSYDPDAAGFLERDEVLAGLPAKRASTLVYLIESRTAQLVARSRQAADSLLSEDAARERELEFLEAFAAGREPPVRPTIQDLERYADAWASLVPENPRIRAVVAHALGERYRIAYHGAPRLRRALGIDDPAVRQAYRRLYRRTLESVFASRVPLPDQLRWRWTGVATRFERLPPFWTSYALTLTETVGATVLALPIALATVGPLAGVAILVVLGLVNVLTIGFMAEAVARSGPIRYGGAYLGRLVSDYLGSAGSLVLSAGLFLLVLLILPVFYIGVGTTLADSTGVPPAVWVAAMFLISLFYLKGRTLNATVASAVAIGGINFVLLVALSQIAFANARAENLAHVRLPFLGGQPFEASFVALVFGVVLAAYDGHTAAVLCGRLVLERDPGGRALRRGCMAGQITSIFLYGLFVLAVNGAVDPRVLASESGTALSPLARQAGPVVLALGSAFVILAMGMGSIHLSLALFNLVRERLPADVDKLFVMPRRTGTLLFRKGLRSGDFLCGLTYLGLHAGAPRFAVDVDIAGAIHHQEIQVTRHWDLSDEREGSLLFERFPELRRRPPRMAIEVVDADQRRARLRVITSLRVSYEGDVDAWAVSAATLLTLPDERAELLAWMFRAGEVSTAEVARQIGGDEAAAREAIRSLAAEGLVREAFRGETRYSARLAPGPRRGLREDVWAVLDKGGSRGDSSSPSWRDRARRALFSKPGRFVLSASPTAAAFTVTQWMLFTNAGSFTGLLGFTGVIVVALLTGIFPVLLLLSSQRKGEFPTSSVYWLRRHPFVLGAIYALYFVSILAHGLVIWETPWERAGALLAATAIAAMTIVMLRRGAFTQRVAVHVQKERDGAAPPRFSVVAGARPTEADVVLEYADGSRAFRASGGDLPRFSELRSAVFRPSLSSNGQVELKIRACEVAHGSSPKPIPARVRVRTGDQAAADDVPLSGGELTLPVSADGLEIVLVPVGDSEEEGGFR